MTTWSHPFSKTNRASSSESTCEVPYSFLDNFFFRFTTSPERRTTTSCSYVFPSIVIAPNTVQSIFIVISSFRHNSQAAKRVLRHHPGSQALQPADLDRDAPPPPTARACLEQARDRGGANAATAVPSEPPGCDVIPISADDRLTTARAIRALAALVMDIPGVDEMQPDLARDIASRRQRGGRRAGQIQHLVVRVEGGEMQGHVRSQPCHHPLAQLLYFLRAVIVTRYKQRCDFEPDLRFVLQIFERFEDGAEMAGAQPFVELLGEPFEVD